MTAKWGVKENMSPVDRLRETQHNSENPELFEEALTEAFQQLGARAVHKGGANEPDVLLEISGRRIVVDAKTTKERVISEAYINFDALERYKEGYEAEHVGVVAVGFSKGYVRDTAEKRGVVLIETEAVCKALENHAVYPYTPQHIYEMVFDSSRTLITPEDIPPSTSGVSGQIEVIKEVLSVLRRLRQSNLDELLVICRYVGLDIEKETIEDALTFLSSPPLNIVKEEDGVYSLTLDFDEMLKRLALLHEALPTLEPVREPKRLGPDVYRHKLTMSDVKHKFIHISARMRSLFPEPDVEFTIESGDKKYVVSCDKHNRIFSGASKWYNDNPAVKEGDVVSLHRLRENVYRLTLE